MIDQIAGVGQSHQPTRQSNLTSDGASSYIDDMNKLTEVTTELDRRLAASAAVEPLETLAAISSLRTVLSEHEREAVHMALAQHSWSEIGGALGVSKQAAFQRFGKQWITEMRATMSPREMRATARRRLSQ